MINKKINNSFKSLKEPVRWFPKINYIETGPTLISFDQIENTDSWREEFSRMFLRKEFPHFNKFLERSR